eukprot:1002377-Prymnesium_polylepis.1
MQRTPPLSGKPCFGTLTWARVQSSAPWTPGTVAPTNQAVAEGHAHGSAASLVLPRTGCRVPGMALLRDAPFVNRQWQPLGVLSERGRCPR